MDKYASKASENRTFMVSIGGLVVAEIAFAVSITGNTGDLTSTFSSHQILVLFLAVTVGGLLESFRRILSWSSLSVQAMTARLPIDLERNGFPVVGDSQIDWMVCLNEYYQCKSNKSTLARLIPKRILLTSDLGWVLILLGLSISCAELTMLLLSTSISQNWYSTNYVYLLLYASWYYYAGILFGIFSCVVGVWQNIHDIRRFGIDWHYVDGETCESKVPERP